MGWPAFTAGSYRGVTRAVAHFRPSYGECIYSCKEAARRLIKSAREVIAIVTDSLTDLDIFKDLQEACTQRRVPVYILLDQLGAPSFLKMCGDVGVRLDDFWEEILAGSTIRCFPAEQLPVNEPVIPSTVSCHASTQTRKSVTDRVARPGSARRHLEGLLPQADQGPSAPLLHCHRGESWRTSPT